MKDWAEALIVAAFIGGLVALWTYVIVLLYP
jgi:hypothetical protein